MFASIARQTNPLHLRAAAQLHHGYVQDGTRLPLPGRTALAAAHWRARQESGVPVRTIPGENWPDRTRMAEQVVAEYLF